MNTAKPQQSADGQRDDSEDLITELARMMASGAQDGSSQQKTEAAESPASAPKAAEAAPASVRIPGQENAPAAPAGGFKFDFAVPKAPAVAAPEPLVNWQERLKRGNAPASPVRLEPTLERVPVAEEPGPAPSFVAPPVAEAPRAPEPAPEPAPAAPPDDGHDAIAELIAAELNVDLQQPAPEPPAASVPETVEEPPQGKPLLRAVNYPAQPRPESDRFSSPPVFGAGSRPAPAAPEAQRPLDPMDEIESLIGAAIQNDHGVRQVVTPPPAPAPVSAAAPAVDDDAAHAAAEAAILAAAAASGVEVSRVAAEPKFHAEEADEDAAPVAAARLRRPRQGGSLRPFIGPVAAGVLLLAAGFGLYWVLGMGHNDGTAPVLTADSTPAKQVPAKPAAPATPAASSAVFDELDGKVPTAGDEQLVSRDQSTGTEVTPAAAEDDGDGLANRKVRTVTVRPDGTIVNAENALAGAELLPVERPNVPDVPNGNLDASDLLNAAAPPQETASLAVNTPPAAATTPAGTPAATDTTLPAVNAPVPMARPTDLAALRQSAPTAPANDLIGNLATQNAAPASNAAAPAYVQLSSQRDQNVAQQSLVEINSRWGSLLKGVLPEVQRVDLGARGIYYRVRVPTDSLSSANYLCQQIKSSGGDCLVTN